MTPTRIVVTGGAGVLGSDLCDCLVSSGAGVVCSASRSEIIHHPLPQDDPVQRQPDISLATERLDWQSAVPLKEGLVPMTEYFERLSSEKRQG